MYTVKLGTKMRVVLGNAFSLGMLRGDATLRIEKISLEEVKKLIKENSNNILSIIGHESTAKMLSTLLGSEVKVNRISYVMQNDDVLIIFQLLVRLREGEILNETQLKALFEEGKASFYKVQMVNN